MSKATDEAGNTESSPNTIAFTCETSGPNVVISTPVASAPGNDYGPNNPLSSVAGTASDSLSGVSSVLVSIADNTTASPNKYWNGTSWINVSTTVAANYSSGNWSVAAPNWGAADRANHLFSVQATAYNNAGNPTTTSAQSFVYDSTAPAVGLIVPNQQYENASLTAISGTAADIDPGTGITSGLQQVQIAILHGGQYLQPSPPNTFNASQNWFTVTGSPWNFTSVPTWVDGNLYEVRARSVDNSGNQSATSIYDFTYDSVYATSTITNISNGQSYKSLNSINGTAFDAISGVQYVQLIIRDLSAYTGNGFWDLANGQFDLTTANRQWGVVSGTSTWTVTNSSFTLTSGHVYLAFSRAVNNANDIPAEPSNWNSFGTQFRYDNQPPVSVTTSPVNGGFYNTPFTGIYGTANDSNTGGSGISIVNFGIQRSNGKWYAGVGNWSTGFPGWGSATAIDGNPGSFNKILTASPWQDGYNYSIMSQSIDNATNVEVAVTTITFTYDTTPPSSQINGPVNANYYNSMTYVLGRFIRHNSVRGRNGFRGKHSHCQG